MREKMHDSGFFLSYIVKEIHSTVAATVDDDGLPVTCAIDMMDWDEGGLYFLTAVGKGFYDRLTKRGYMALTGVKGDTTLSSIAVSVRGKVREIGSDALPMLLEKNRYMYEIYPTEESRKALTVFKLHQGSGEWFDLSKRPIERFEFSFGGDDFSGYEYSISSACTGCGACIPSCPQNCIDSSSVPYSIEEEHCLHCGMCLRSCPFKAVEFKRRRGE